MFLGCLFRPVVVTLVLAWASVSPVSASILIELNTPFPENSSTLKPEPDGSPPWLTAEFAQLGANLVQLTLNANLTLGNMVMGGQGGGKVQWGWGFNFNDAKDASDLVFNAISGNTADKIGTEGGYKPDGLASVFDILFGWGTNDDAFQGSHTAVYEISLTAGGLLESDFDFFSEPTGDGNAGVFKSAAHIQEISAPAGSTWIGGNGSGTGSGNFVPEPASAFVWALIICLAISRRSNARP